MDCGCGREVVNTYAHRADPCPEFRNLAAIELRLDPGSVIVGENRSGKSNLIHALRLVVDTSLSIADRQLDRDDFWDGLSDGSQDWDPLSAGHVIEVSIDIVGFTDNARVLAALADALVQQDPPRVRLTYRFGPVDMGDDAIPVASRRCARLPPRRPTRPTATPTPNASPKPSWPLIACGRRCGARSCGSAAPSATTTASSAPSRNVDARYGPLRSRPRRPSVPCWTSCAAEHRFRRIHVRTPTLISWRSDSH